MHEAQHALHNLNSFNRTEQKISTNANNNGGTGGGAAGGAGGGGSGGCNSAGGDICTGVNTTQTAAEANTHKQQRQQQSFFETADQITPIS
jgi:hypothetical protein